MCAECILVNKYIVIMYWVNDLQNWLKQTMNSKSAMHIAHDVIKQLNYSRAIVK